MLAESKYKHELILELRQQLHALAEPSMQELKTKALLMQFLREHTSLELVDCGSWFYAIHRARANKLPSPFVLILMLCCVRMAVHGIYVVMMGTALFWLAWA